MPGKTFTPAQIVRKLQQVARLTTRGKTAEQACKQAGIDARTYKRWRKEYGALATRLAKSGNGRDTNGHLLTVAREQQAATAEILRVISDSPQDLPRIFDAILKSAVQLCDGVFSTVLKVDGNLVHLVGLHNWPAGVKHALREAYPMPLDGDYFTARGIREKRVLHFTDLQNDTTAPALARKLSKIAHTQSLLLVPMIRRGDPAGAILVAGKRAFSDDQIALLKTFADQAVIAIENARLFNETKEALERQTGTAEILNVISRSPTDVQPVFDAIVSSGIRLFQGVAVALRLVEHDRIVRAAFAMDPGSGVANPFTQPSVPLDETSVTGRAVLRREVVHVPDIHLADWVGEESRSLAKRGGWQAVAAAPMLRADKVLGAIAVVRARPAPFRDKELALLKTFADQAVIAIENARLFSETKEALEQQTATSEILKVIAGSPSDVQPVFDTIVQNAVRLGNAAVGFLVSYDGTTMELVAQENIEPDEASIYSSSFPRPATRDTMTGRAILERSVLNIPDISSSDFGEGPKQRARRGGYRSALIVPLLRSGEPIGALNIETREEGGFSDAFIALSPTRR